MKIENPYIIEFSKIGESNLGYISVAEKTNLPFVPKRIYWTYYTPEEIIRGRHAHYKLNQILIALSGRIIVTTESTENNIQLFELNKPNIGLLVPPLFWHTMQFSHNSVLLCIAENEYDESDYIRSYQKFKSINLK